MLLHHPKATNKQRNPKAAATNCQATFRALLRYPQHTRQTVLVLLGPCSSCCEFRAATSLQNWGESTSTHAIPAEGSQSSRQFVRHREGIEAHARVAKVENFAQRRGESASTLPISAEASTIGQDILDGTTARALSPARPPQRIQPSQDSSQSVAARASVHPPRRGFAALITNSHLATARTLRPARFLFGVHPDQDNPHSQLTRFSCIVFGVARSRKYESSLRSTLSQLRLETLKSQF